MPTIFEKLKTMKLWHLLWISLALSEILTAIMNVFIGHLLRDSIDRELLIIGSIDAFVVAFIVSVIILLLFREITRHERRAQEALRQAGEMWGRTFDSISDLIMILDANYRVVRMNRAMSEKLNVPPHAAEGILCYEHVHGMKEPPPYCLHAQLLADGREHSAEMYSEKLGGHYLITATPLTDDRGRVTGSVHTAKDITARKRAEQELDRHRLHLEEMVAQRTQELRNTVERLEREIGARAAAEENLERNRLFLLNILNSIQDPIMVLDNDQRVMMTNRRFETNFLGGHAVKPFEKTCYEIFYKRSQPCENCLSNIAMTNGTLVNREISYGKDKSERWYDVSAYPLTTAEDRTIGSVHHMRDITTRKQAEEHIREYQDHLRSLAHQVLAVEERERRKIAQALHDGFLQNLALCRMNAKTVQSGLSRQDDAAAQLQQIHDLLGEMMNNARSLTYQLAPPILYELGLEPAVKRLLETLLTGAGIAWSLDGRRVMPPLRGDLAPVLYAMVRELVMNILKHANAGRVNVVIDEDDEHITVTVEDNGIGMTLPDAAAGPAGGEGGGFGLFSINERLRHLGGRLEIDSPAGNGTRAQIVIPFAFNTAAGSPSD